MPAEATLRHFRLRARARDKRCRLHMDDHDSFTHFHSNLSNLLSNPFFLWPFLVVQIELIFLSVVFLPTLPYKIALKRM